MENIDDINHVCGTRFLFRETTRRELVAEASDWIKKLGRISTSTVGLACNLCWYESIDILTVSLINYQISARQRFYARARFLAIACVAAFYVLVSLYMRFLHCKLLSLSSASERPALLRQHPQFFCYLFHQAIPYLYQSKDYSL